MKAPEDPVEIAKQTLVLEAAALQVAANRLGDNFLKAHKILLECSGKVICTGLGKSGLVARKISATLASTGTPSFFMHAGEALHGDLGMLTEGDCLLPIAFGGETHEVLEVCRSAKRRNIKIICITGKAASSLAKISDIAIDGSVEKEACPLNLAPTCSSTLALALGDALAMSLMSGRSFKTEEFATYHPGGALGRKLMMVNEVMRTQGEFQAVNLQADFNEIMEKITQPNFGIIAVTDGTELVGVITDGDLRRALIKYRGEAVNKSAAELMGGRPKTISSTDLAVKAVKEMEDAKVTSLFVLDSKGQLDGLVRMHDLLDKKIV